MTTDNIEAKYSQAVYSNVRGGTDEMKGVVCVCVCVCVWCVWVHAHVCVREKPSPVFPQGLACPLCRQNPDQTGHKYV